MSGQEPPRIEFPCDYPVTVVADAGRALRERVFATFEDHAPGFDRAAVTERASRNGNSPKGTVAVGKGVAWFVVECFLNHDQWADDEDCIVRIDVGNAPSVSVTNKL